MTLKVGGVKSVRLLVEHEGTLRKLCTLGSTLDGSIYVLPYSPSGSYFYGAMGVEAHELSATAPFRTEPPVADVPRLSIHSSGTIHVKLGSSYLAGPVTVPPLQSWAGEHVATVGADHFASLPELEGRVRTGLSRPDHVLHIAPGVQAGRVALYLNAGDEPRFTGDVNVVWPLRHSQGWYVGLAVLEHEPLSESGCYSISGWPPRMAADEAATILFVRGA